MTRSWAQPAWQRTSTLQSSAAWIEKLGRGRHAPGIGRSSRCPALRPPRALARVSAVMACRSPLARKRACLVVRRARHLGARPFGEDREEAMTFSAICRASSRLRSRPKRGCQTWRVRSIRLSFAVCDVFTEDLTGGYLPLRAPGLRSRNPTDDAGPCAICISGVPIAGIAAIGTASARQFFLGDGELVRLAGLDDEFAPVAFPDAARNGAPE